MAKQPRVWTGTQWDTLAVTLPDLSNYSTTTQMNTAITNNVGLVPIVSQNFTAASTIDVLNCFSSTYSNYIMTVNLTAASTGNYANFQFLSGSTPSTSSYYFGYYGWTSSAGASTAAGSNISNVYFLEYSSGSPSSSLSNVQFFNPNKNSTTSFAVDIVYDNGTGTTARRGGGGHGVSASYTGIRLAPQGGTITGTVRIYGLKD